MKKGDKACLQGFTPNIILVFLSSLFCLVGFELLLRLTMNNTRPIYIYDPDLGHRHPPGANYMYARDEFSHQITINSQGWRDIERTHPKLPGVYRILVLGDSYTEALQVSSEETFIWQLEASLNKKLAGRKKVEVLNMGVSGYGTTEEYQLLLKYGLAFNPDMVMLALLTGNDVSNNSLYLEQRTRDWNAAIKPYLELTSSGPVMHPPIAAAKMYERQGSRWIFDKIHLIQFVHKRMSRNVTTRKFLVAVGLMDRSNYATYQDIPVDYWVYVPDQDQDWQQAWQVTEYLLKIIHELLEERGIAFFVMVLTNREQVYEDDWHQILETYPAMQNFSWDLEQPERKIEATLTKLNIDYVRLLPTFREAAAEEPGIRLHFRGDGHWTPEGHALAARVLYGQLLPCIEQP